jgi:hypothetical protein
MPTKTPYLGAYRVVGPEDWSDESWRETVRRTLASCHSSHRGDKRLSDEHLTLVQSIEGTILPIRPKDERFVDAREYFARTSSIQAPICVLRTSKRADLEVGGQRVSLAINGRSDPVVVEALSENQTLIDLKNAIAGTRPMRWPDKLSLGELSKAESVYLFSRWLWTLSKSERLIDDPDELRLVFQEAVDRERRKFERLRLRFEGLAGDGTLRERTRIPEDVRMYVWRRDGGACALCGSTEKLEYDHIIPIAMGGSNTERNVQLLCETCNRKKSDRV